MAPFNVGDIFEQRYRILAEVGGGAYTIVYRAEQLAIGRDVAIKLLTGAEHQPEIEERFSREVGLLARLRHPNTIILIDFGRASSGALYFVTEFVPGRTVEQIIRDDGPLAPDRCFRIVRQVLGSLREAHAHGVIHRDLKPANVMVYDRVDEREVVKLLDFGIAAFLDEVSAGVVSGTLTGRGELPGTPRYMAPEALRGEALGATTDLFSVGLIIYEMILGRPAIEGDTAIEVLARQFTGRPAIAPNDRSLPPPVDRLVRRATAHAPSDRIQDAAAFIKELDFAAAEITNQGATVPQNRPVGRMRPIARPRSVTVLGPPIVGGLPVPPGRGVHRSPPDSVDEMPISHAEPTRSTRGTRDTRPTPAVSADGVTSPSSVYPESVGARADLAARYGIDLHTEDEDDGTIAQVVEDRDESPTRNLPKPTPPDKAPTSRFAAVTSKDLERAGAPTSSTGVPSPHAKVLAKALMTDATIPIAGYEDVEELARSLIDRLNAPRHDEHTEEISVVDDHTMDGIIPEPDWDPESGTASRPGGATTEETTKELTLSDMLDLVASRKLKHHTYDPDVE